MSRRGLCPTFSDGSPLVDHTIMIPLQDFSSLHLVKPSSLGDIIHTLPLLSAFALHPFAPSFRSWVINETWAPLLEGHPSLHEIHPFPRQKMKGLAMPFAFTQWLVKHRMRPRPEGRELILDVQGLLRSGLIATARARKEDIIMGLSDSREFSRYFHHVIVSTKDVTHAVDRYLKFAEVYDIPTPPEIFHPELPQESGPWENRLQPTYVVLHPYSRGKGKALSTETARRLCQLFSPYQVVLVGQPSPGERAPDERGILNLTGRTSLPQLTRLLARAAAVVSVDSGPMHLAAAVQPNTLGIHTWSDPRKVGPYSSTAAVWKSRKIRHFTQWTADEASQNFSPGESDLRAIAEWVHERIAASNAPLPH